MRSGAELSIGARGGALPGPRRTGEFELEAGVVPGFGVVVGFGVLAPVWDGALGA